MSDTWFAIEVTAEPRAIEAVEFVLNELGALGTEVQQFHKTQDEPLTVNGYFDQLPDTSLFDEKLSLALSIYDLTAGSITSLQRKTIEETDWLAEWKKHWRSTRVGRFLIVPEWLEAKHAERDSVVIRIDPSMAFGTGTHETTQLCLHAIGAGLRPGDRFLDVGTGTGILAIAAAKMLGRSNRKIVAVDNDPVAVENARENALRNQVDYQIEFSCEEISPSTPKFDFVCANLTLDVIMPILPLLVEKTIRSLVLSGVLKEQESVLLDELRRLGHSDVRIETAGEWISATVSVDQVSQV